MDAKLAASAAPVVLFGATGGIGSALARRLAGRGHPLWLAARRSDPLAQLATELGARWSVVDVTQPEQVEGALQAAQQAWGPLAGAALSVGSILLRPAHLTSPEQVREVLALNLEAPFHLLRAWTRTQAGGSLVFFSTAAARIGLPNHEAIAAAKAGLEGMVRSAAATYAARDLRINAVAPGLVETPLAARLTNTPAAREASLALHALGRLGSPEDVAAAAAWLLDPDTRWVTGQVIGVDGGLSTVRAPPRPSRAS